MLIIRKNGSSETGIFQSPADALRAFASVKAGGDYPTFFKLAVAASSLVLELKEASVTYFFLPSGCFGISGRMQHVADDYAFSVDYSVELELRSLAARMNRS